VSLELAQALLRRVEAAISGQEEQRAHALNLIASQNLMSPAARAAHGSAFADKLAGSALGRRGNLGTRHVDALETAMLEAAQHLYGTGHVEYRLMSGSVANQTAMVAAFPAGATVLVMPRAASGDRSIQERGYPRWVGAKVVELPWDYERGDVDLDGLRGALQRHRPAWVVIGGSRPLFPYAVPAVRDEAAAVGCRVFYDGAHILGLWAGGQFQDPLAEGADLVTGSTQKTLPGPVGGLCLTRDADLGRRVAAVLDDVIADYGNARVAALAVTLCEMLAFGRDYASAVVGNARALGRALAAEGFDVVAAERGFTASHQTLVITAGARVADVGPALEAASILCTPVRVVRRNGGEPEPALRLGSCELTRRGMGRDEMGRVARFIRRLLLDGESPDRVQADVRDLLAGFGTVHYAFPGPATGDPTRRSARRAP
jgi:glycine hydroxymethyltransferase